MYFFNLGLWRGDFSHYRASVGMLARSSGTSFQAALSVPTDESMEWSCVAFACDVLLVCACPVHVGFLSAAVNGLAGCCRMRSLCLCVCNGYFQALHTEIGI
jgi:hypothetical protein